MSVFAVTAVVQGLMCLLVVFWLVRRRLGEGLVSWCFNPSQPQRILSGLRENFIKRYIVERTNKA